MKLHQVIARRATISLTKNLSHGFLIGAIIAGSVLVFSSVLFWAFEDGRNPRVDKIVDGILWVTRTLLQGEPPFEPVTGVGHALFYVVVITGVGIIAIITAQIASKIIQWIMRKEAGMGRARYSDHVVICGWSAKAQEIVRELHASGVIDKPPIALIAPLQANPVDDDLVTFIHGSPNDADALKRAGIESAKAAIILADDTNTAVGPDERDAMTLLTALAVESINPNVHTCVEVIRSENLPHFRRAKVDEVVVSAELTGNILAASAVTHGLSHVVADLTGHEHGMEFYGAEAPAALHGRPFVEALDRVKTGADALLVGVASDGHKYDLNPPSDRRIEAGDRLLLISEDDPKPRLKSLGAR